MDKYSSKHSASLEGSRSSQPHGNATPALVEPLKKNFPDGYVIGDGVEPRKIYQAIHEAAFVGRTL